mgnify:CR=1 FL=1
MSKFLRGQHLVGGADVDPNIADAPVFCIQNSVTASALTSTTADTNYPLSNLANPATFLEWRGTSTSAETITVTIANDASDYVGIAAHNFGSEPRTIKIQGDAGAGYVDLSEEFTPADDGPLLFKFAQAGYTGLRVVLGAGSTVPRMAILYAGLSLTSQRNIYVGHRPINLNQTVKQISPYSENGHFLGRIITAQRNETQVELENLTPMWVRGNLDPFIVQARERPFFFAWRPYTYSQAVGFVWLTGDPAPSNSRADGMMSVSMTMAGVV